MAASSAGWKLRNSVPVALVAVLRSIVGLAFTSQVGCASINAKSSGEHDISGVSPPAGVINRGRVCETAEVVQTRRAKQVTRTRANGFRSTINGNYLLLSKFVFLFLIVRRAPLKTRHLSGWD